MMPPSIQNPVAISSSAGTIGGIINVQDTTYFPDEGYYLLVAEVSFNILEKHQHHSLDAL